jgi:hypothetical protein
MPSDRLADLSFVPATGYVESTLRIRSRGGYQEVPAESDIDAAEHLVRSAARLELPPAVLSGRGRWIVSGTRDLQIRVFDAAAILRGQLLIAAFRRLADAGEPSRDVPFVIYPHLSDEAERVIYALDGASPGTHLESNYGGQEAPRRHEGVVTISTRWTTLKLESEPFVARTSRGYAPALHVRDLESGRNAVLYASAKSLALALEGIRARRGGLIGTEIQVRKSGDDRYATYDVLERDHI